MHTYLVGGSYTLHIHILYASNKRDPTHGYTFRPNTQITSYLPSSNCPPSSLKYYAIMFSPRWQPVISLPTRFGPAVTLTLPDMEMHQMLRGGRDGDESRERIRDSSSAQSTEQIRPVTEGGKDKRDVELSRMQLVSVVRALVCSMFLVSRPCPAVLNWISS